MQRRTFLQTGAASLAASSVPVTKASAETESLPNLVFMLCDDLGYGDLSCYGHPVIRTPHLDRLAGEGIRFTDCYSAAPVCSPARAGALTGRNPYRCRIPDWIPTNSPNHLQYSELSIARLLKDRGYATAHCGKWHLSGTLDGSQPTPGSHGFDHWFSTQNNASPTHENPVNFVRNGDETGIIRGYSSEIIAEESIEFMRAHRDRPFCVFIWFHSPHEPVASGEDFMNLYADEDDLTVREYYGNVSQTDHAVGMVARALRDMNLEDDTLMLFTSDNGPETLNRYRGSHRSHGTAAPLRGMKLELYEGGIRVPGIARWKGVTPVGLQSDEPVSGVDILPTFCELAGLLPPSDRAIDGSSVVNALRGEPVNRQRPLYWRYDRSISRPTVAMRDGDWKILSDTEFRFFELYNLREDLAETRDRAGDEPQRLAAMKEQLLNIHYDVQNDPVSKWTPWRG